MTRVGIVLLCVLAAAAGATYHYAGQWGTHGAGNGQFNYALGIAVAPNGNVYVADAYNNRIQYFSPTGSFLGKWGTVGTGAGQFDTPWDVAVAANTGHIQIHERGFHDNQSIDYAFIPDRTVIDTLESAGAAVAFSERIHAAGLVSSGDTTEVALIEAVDPESERRVTDMHRAILAGGRYLEAGDRKNIIIGEVLARNLNVGLGGTVSMISQGFDGSFAAEDLTIVGLFRTGNAEYDRTLLIMPLARARETFSMMNYVNSVVIRLRDGTAMEQTRDDLRKSIGGKNLEIMGWDELMPEMILLINMKKISTLVFTFILFIIVSFGVLNTIQMSVFERVREFGISMAIGTSPGHVRQMVQVEAFIITLLGILLGAALGSAISLYFTIRPLDYSMYQDMTQLWGISSTIFPARLEFTNVLRTSGFMFILSSLFAFFPARRASRLNIINAIRKL